MQADERLLLEGVAGRLDHRFGDWRLAAVGIDDGAAKTLWEGDLLAVIARGLRSDRRRWIHRHRSWCVTVAAAV
jgi:hypothetical protein